LETLSDWRYNLKHRNAPLKHIRKTNKKAKGFTKLMSALNRKQIPLCSNCHVERHHGKDDGISLKDLWKPQNSPQGPREPSLPKKTKTKQKQKQKFMTIVESRMQGNLHVRFGGRLIVASQLSVT
jgi:hypothetical protein